MTERSIPIVVIGAGQAGLAAGYHLQRRGQEFLLLDAGQDPGETWRRRWASLRLFTPACYDALPGLAFPAPRGHLPTKDEMADYLEDYADRFALPIEHGMMVQRLERVAGRYRLTAAGQHLLADRVIVATGANNVPQIPTFAHLLDPAISQRHSSAYEHPEQVTPGSVLVVGAGNSGAEIAVDLATIHDVTLAGRDVGHLPTVPGCGAYKVLSRLRVDTRLGRWVAARRATGGDPVVRVRPRDLVAAGVRRVPRVTGVRAGLPLLEDGRTIAVDHVVWATGFVRDLSWIRLPILDARGSLRHDEGVATCAPGLGFVGFPLQRTITSDLVGGVGADAERVVAALTSDGAAR